MPVRKSADVMSARKSNPVTNPATGKTKRVREVVGKAEWDHYLTLAEAVSAMGETTILALANSQNGTNAKNAVRSAAVGAPSEKSLQQEAFMRLASTEAGQAQLKAVAGDPVRFAALLADTVATIKTEKGLEDDEDTTDEEEPAVAV